MTRQDKTPRHIKFDERNHVEETLLNQFDGPGHTALTQYLLTGKKRVTTRLKDTGEITS